MRRLTRVFATLPKFHQVDAPTRPAFQLARRNDQRVGFSLRPFSTSPIPKNKSNSSRNEDKGQRFQRRRLLKWFVLGAFAAGAGLYAYQVFVPDYRSLVDPKHYYTDWKIRLYTSLPWNAVSSLAGSLSAVYVPVILREPLYGWYVRVYGCRMDEAKEESLRAYPTFGAFFNRALKDGVRPISHSLLVSPADGTVLHFGPVENGTVVYVKDHDYEIHEFLGPINVDTRAGNSLFQVVIYLAPGDYHAFHSSAKWYALEKVYFPGYLLSVRPSNLQKIPNLFCMNERVVLSGQWIHGYFSMSAVAATNVGDIAILDETNKNRRIMHTEQYDIYDETRNFQPGDKVGEFRLGSTIVLIFEAPSNIQFCIKAGDWVRYGQSILFQHR